MDSRPFGPMSLQKGPGQRNSQSELSELSVCHYHLTGFTAKRLDDRTALRMYCLAKERDAYSVFRGI